MGEDQAEGKEHLSFDLQKLVEIAENQEGIDLASVNPGDFIVLRTRNSIYAINVQSPANKEENKSCEGVIKGGVFPEPTHIQVRGSTLGGTSIIVHQLKKGMHAEFAQPLEESERIGFSKYKFTTTSTVESLGIVKTQET
ncbi:hypothetical protein HYV21_01825 [Candidatus Microgenomates bacterium]|nr:hypothetical protein [Candidatus Microgenomates bacterium]